MIRKNGNPGSDARNAESARSRAGGRAGSPKGGAPPRGPLVSLMICTYNRPEYLADALRSAVRQTWPNLQIIVLNDGGQDIADVVEPFKDARGRALNGRGRGVEPLTLIQRKENRGYAASLNEALEYAEGKYVAYLGDDDVHYDDHVECLVAALEGPTDCQVAYSNLYRTMFRVLPDGSRLAVGKVLEIRRDFERFFMFYFNQALGGSLMHRRELLDRTGPYNEKVKVLVDWDMARRMSFFSDFLHVHHITGEYCIPEEKVSDRISHRMRRDMKEFKAHYLMIRTARPPKPWPKVQDLSIIIPADHLHPQIVNMVMRVIDKTFWPFMVYLVLPERDVSSLNIKEVSHIVTAVPVAGGAPYSAMVDAALRECEGEFVALAPPGVELNDMWVERPLYALMNSAHTRQGYLLASPGGSWAALLRRGELADARSRFPALGVRRSVEAADIVLRKVTDQDNPLVMDDFLTTVRALEIDGDWHHARAIYEKMPELCRNELWMKDRAALALYNKGTQDAEALELCREVNRRLPTADSVLLEAKLHRRMDRTESAVGLLEQAREILQWKA